MSRVGSERERERRRENASKGGAERERETQDLNEAGSRLWAVSTEPIVGLEVVNREILIWVEVRRLTDWTTQPQACELFNVYLFWERALTHKQGRGRKRGWGRESQAGSVMSAHSLTRGSISRTMGSWPEPKPKSWMLNGLSYPGTPEVCELIFAVSVCPQQL